MRNSTTTFGGLYHLSNLQFIHLFVSDSTKIMERVKSLQDSEPASPKPTATQKRDDYIEWHEYFMAMAFLAAKRSKDPCTQVGAVIVNDEKKIVGIGYNGLPIGCSDDAFPWGKDTANPLDSKYMYVVHAEVNAILNKNSSDVKDCTLYVALFPCNECAKIIIQSRIREIFYMSDKHAEKSSTIGSKRMLDAAGVKYSQLVPRHKQLLIDFEEIDWDAKVQAPPTPKKNGV